jgi:hypothetical protein
MVALGQASKAETYEDKFEYELKSGAAIITKYIGSDVQVAIPETIAGATRILIEAGTFASQTLSKVIILNNVKKIEKGAFVEGTKAVIYGKQDSVAEEYAKENNIEFRVYGDINGDNNVTATDSLKVKRHIVELSGQMLNEGEQISADVNCDEKVTTTDLLVLKKVIVGLDETEGQEETEDVEEPEEPENEETSQENVTVTYVTEPSLYPELLPEDVSWKKELNNIRKKLQGNKFHLTKDISKKEYTVPKGTIITITNEKPVADRYYLVPVREDDPCGNFYLIKFYGEWITDKVPEIVDKTVNGEEHIVKARMGDKS